MRTKRESRQIPAGSPFEFGPEESSDPENASETE